MEVQTTKSYSGVYCRRLKKFLFLYLTLFTHCIYNIATCYYLYGVKLLKNLIELYPLCSKAPNSIIMIGVTLRMTAVPCSTYLYPRVSVSSSLTLLHCYVRGSRKYMLHLPQIHDVFSSTASAPNLKITCLDVL